MPSSSLGSIYFLIKDVVTLSIGDLFDGMAAMTIIGEQLFCNWYLDDDLRYRAGAGLRQAVDWMLGDEFAKHTDEELVNRVVAEASMTPLEVSFDEKRKADPIKINVTGRPDYGFDRRPTWTDGIRVTQTIPFKDNRNRDLWRMSTNPCTSNPPYGEIRAEALVVGKEVPVSEADQAMQYIDGVVVKLREYLGRQEAQIQRHNDNLRSRAFPLVQQRRVHFVSRWSSNGGCISIAWPPFGKSSKSRLHPAGSSRRPGLAN
jgi:hypothetical protein